MQSPYHRVPDMGADDELFTELVRSTTELEYAFPSPTLTAANISKLPYITTALRPLELNRISVRRKRLGVSRHRQDIYKAALKRRIARPPMQKLGIMVETMVTFLLENGVIDNEFGEPFKAMVPLAQKIVSDVFYKDQYKGTSESLIISQGIFNDDTHKSIVDFSWVATFGARAVVNFYELKISSDTMPANLMGFIESGSNTVNTIIPNKIILHAFRQMLPALTSAHRYIQRNPIACANSAVTAGVVYASIATSEVRVFVYRNITTAWLQALRVAVKL